MPDVEKLSDIARRCLEQDTIEEKNNQIGFIKTRLIQKGEWLRSLDYTCWTASLGLIALALVYALPAPTLLPRVGIALAVIGTAFFMWAIAGKRFFQYRKQWLTAGRQYSGDIPPELQQLLNDLSEERLIPFEADEREYIPGDVKRASDGTPIRSWPRKKIFENRYALLLLSPDIEAYAYVWQRKPFVRTIEGTLCVDWMWQENEHHWCRPISKPKSEIQPLEITAVKSTSSAFEAPEPAGNVSISPTSESQSEIEPPQMVTVQSASPDCGTPEPTQNPSIANNEPKDRWLVRGTDEEFEEGLEFFLAASPSITSDQSKWYRTVLRAGRREVQMIESSIPRGVLKSVIVKIKKVLIQELGSDKGPNGGNSKHVIAKLLRGDRSGHDIRGYFKAHFSS